MKFTIQPEPFIRMLELVAEPEPERSLTQAAPAPSPSDRPRPRSAPKVPPVSVLAPPRSRLREVGRRGERVVSVTTCHDRVCIQRGATAAEMEALVWEDGRCTVSQSDFLAALKAARNEANLTVQAGRHGLRIGESSLPVVRYFPSAPTLGTFQIFLSTDFGVVPSPAPAGVEA